MDITIEKKEVPSTDGVHTLKGVVYIPHGEIKGLFHIVHGMTEYIGRYEHFMKEMSEHGYICFGYDNLGHGNTANSEEELGFIAHEKGWQYLVKDVGAFAEEMKKQYPNMPYYLMGHSMGSFIVRCASVSSVKPDKLIIMGTGGANIFSGVGLATIKQVKRLKGDYHRSDVLQTLAFGLYNSHFSKENDEHSWLSKDEQVRKNFREDKFCNFKFTASAMEDLVRLNRESNSKRFFNGVDKKMPIMLLSGDSDPVGSYGKGVKSVYNKLVKSGANVRMKLYQNCRHEILNDDSHEEVVKDITEFLAE